METLPTTFSAEAYFQTQLPPSTIESDIQSVRGFLKQQRENGKKVVLVTVRVSIGLLQRPKRVDPGSVCRRAEGRLFLWSSMCERINSLSRTTINLIHT